MRLNRARFIAVLPLAAALAACASTTDGKGVAAQIGAVPTTGHSAGTAPTATGSAVASGGSSSSARALAALLEHGVAGVRSAHFTLDTSAGGETVTGTGTGTGTGTEKLSQGKVQALRIAESVHGLDIELVVADGKTYAKLPAAMNPSAKPWVLLSPDSSDPTVRQLAQTIGSALSQGASLRSIGALAGATTSTRVVGKQTIDGVATTHYDLVIDPTKIVADPTTKQSLLQSGITSIPMQLYVDDQGRPVEVSEQLTAASQSVTTKIELSRYNQPVTISAPPRSQVSR